MRRGNVSMFKQLIGNYLYYLATKSGEEYKEGLYQLIPSYILTRGDVWSTEDDKVKVVGYAEILNDLLSKARPGTLMPDIKVEGEYIKGQRSTHRKISLRKLRGKENIVIFHTEGCHICEGQISKAKALAASDSNVHVFLVNMDEIISGSGSLSSSLFDAFDLSVLPFVIQIDKKGNIIRRYLTLL